jgi:TPR repeat protein
MREIGFAFLQGKGTKKDFKKGRAFLAKAGERGDSAARRFLMDVTPRK